MALFLRARPSSCLPCPVLMHSLSFVKQAFRRGRWPPLLSKDSSLLTASGALAATSVSASRRGVMIGHELGPHLHCRVPNGPFLIHFYRHTNVPPGQQTCCINKLFCVLYHVNLDDLPPLQPSFSCFLPLPQDAPS